MSLTLIAIRPNSLGIVGVQLWQGLLRNRCFSTSNNTSLEAATNATLLNLFYIPEDGSDFVCSVASGMQKCSDVPYKYSASNFSKCMSSGLNPFKNAISFDNIGYAFIVVFQVVTLESWAPVMYLVQDAHTSWSWIYFVAVIIVSGQCHTHFCEVPNYSFGLSVRLSVCP
jgi:hypothetical protein